MSDAKDALDAMGISLEEAVEVDESLRERPSVRDGRVCLCGHGMGRHSTTGGVVWCKPARMDCPCKKIRPVIEVEDTRPFLRKTAGGGMMHALVRGISAVALSGKPVTWLVDLKCDKCGAEGKSTGVVPVPVTKNGIASDEATGYDALLCQKCRMGG
jgi:hypothetical protein